MLRLALACVLAAACTDAETPVADAGVFDAAAPDPDLAPNTTYPAFRPPVPLVVKGPGPAMTSVHVVPVFFPNDPIEPDLKKFLAQWAASSEWAATVGDYGVGALSIETAIEVPTAPPVALTDAEIQTFLLGQLDGSQPPSGATFDTTVYALYYPSATTISFMRGTSCRDFSGYHEWAALPADAGVGNVVYAVIPECYSELQAATVATSHEIVEAATNPLGFASPAWDFLANRFLGWERAFGGNELCDMCEVFDTSFYAPADVGYVIQRCWSNKSAARYGQQCVPIPPSTGPAFAAAPVLPDQVSWFNGVKVVQIDGVNIPFGQSRTIDVQLFSEAPVGDWEVSAIDQDQANSGGIATLSLTLDRTKGNNGDILHLTISPIIPTADGVANFLIVSDGGGTWVGTVGITN